MALTEGDKAIVQEIAWEVSKTIVKRMEKVLDEKIELHVETCPYGKKIKQIRPLIIGFVLGFLAVSGFAGWSIVKILSLL